MGCNGDATTGKGLRYIASFEEKLLGAACEVEVGVDLESLATEATVAMRQKLHAAPAFRIASAELAAIAAAVRQARARVRLLEALPEGAQDHLIECVCGGASLTLVQPPKRPPRYVLSIGSYRREGEVAELATADLDAAVARVEALMALTRARVQKAR